MITNTPRAVTYFSFPAYESHFDNQKEDQEATSATPPVQQMVLLPTQLDTVTGADPVIQRDSCREAETELSLFLAGPSSSSTSQISVSSRSEPSSCASSIISPRRRPSLIRSIRTWWRLSQKETSFGLSKSALYP
ncbi:hypothetical protein H4Q26_012269 [Puccinia striiformis f. sp. tritici PST-130]|nr:hypothetical protein H4Q26_012269 [Puccinia striiformis f. sp. tritici PST-130]